MSGRLDPNQKGYDVLLRAIQKLGGADERAKFILTPMPVRNSDLDYFRKTAELCAGNITVFPIRMAQGYKELQLGCSYGVMPSIYEPFGAAVEYMVNGTLNIARATGGLVNQITNNKSGLLFLEEPASKTDDGIRDYFSYMFDVEKRYSHINSWAESMANALLQKIEEAIKIFDTDKYYEMIINGFEKADEFDWMKSSEKYYRVFKKGDN
jgi:glycosyltransferase involved in cell wall biosynthesis